MEFFIFAANLRILELIAFCIGYSHAFSTQIWNTLIFITICVIIFLRFYKHCVSQSSRKNSVEEAIVLMSNTLEYLITVQNKKKLPFILLTKKKNLMLYLSNSRLLVSIWMLNMWMEWLLLILIQILVQILDTRIRKVTYHNLLDLVMNFKSELLLITYILYTWILDIATYLHQR